MNSIRDAYRGFCKAEEVVVGVIIVAITAVVFATAIARYMGSPISWGIDVPLLLFAWLTFLSADVALKRADFMSVGLLVNRFSPRVQKTIYYLGSIISLCFLALIIKAGVTLASDGWTRQFQSLGISYSWATLSAPVGAFLMSVTIIIRLVQRWPEQRVEVAGRESL